jgi:hypothetical protein
MIFADSDFDSSGCAFSFRRLAYAETGKVTFRAAVSDLISQLIVIAILAPAQDRQ